MTIKVDILGDGNFEIEWDENDPIESQLNEWSEDDFVNAILQGCEQLMSITNPTKFNHNDTGDINS